MEFPDANFEAVVDKGTLDALMSDDSEKVNNKKTTRNLF